MMPWADTRMEARGPRPEDARPMSPRDEVEAETPSVLITDDDPAVRAMIARTLRMLGHSSVSTAKGFEAPALASRHAASLELRVAEVGTPGLSGAELARTVAALRPRVPVLLLSGARAPRATVSNRRAGELRRRRTPTPRRDDR